MSPVGRVTAARTSANKGNMKKALSISILALFSGCFLWTTTGQGKELTQRADTSDQRLSTIETGLAADRAELRNELEGAKTQVAELQRVIEQAASVVTRNSADTGAQVQTLTQQLGVVEGQIAELRNDLDAIKRQLAEQRAEDQRRLDQIARKIGLDAPVDASQIPADKAEHYATAYRAHQAGDYSKARSLFREYITRYAQDDNADNAQYWIGASHLAENQPSRALGELRKVLSDYSRGDAVDEALFDMADAFYKLHACGDARTSYEALIRTYTSSPLIQRAREKLREVQRAPRGYCTS